MNVNGRTVCVVESHEDVLGDWAEAARDAGRALTLLTLDRHLDTAPALTAEFADAEHDGGGSVEPPGDLARRRRRVLSRFHGAAPEELGGLIARLRNDEHIDAALGLGILERALIVCSGAARTGDASIPGATVYRPVCAPGCGNASHAGVDCERRRYDAILESALLGPALAYFGSLAAADHGPVRKQLLHLAGCDGPGLRCSSSATRLRNESPSSERLALNRLARPRWLTHLFPDRSYVLDIDLDAFSTRRGLAPLDVAVFHALIAGARLVTIAREPEYVSESMDAHGADEIEATVLRHVAAAMDAVRVAGRRPGHPQSPWRPL